MIKIRIIETVIFPNNEEGNEYARMLHDSLFENGYQVKKEFDTQTITITSSHYSMLCRKENNNET